MDLDGISFTKPSFGDELQEQVNDRRVAKAQCTQRNPFEVAPGCSVTGRDGVKREGAQIRVGVDLDQRTLDVLVARRVVLAVSERDVRARTMFGDSRFVVAPGRSFTTRARGIVAEGEPISDADFAYPARAAIVAVAAHVNAQGIPVPASEASPAVPAFDGRERLHELIEQGAVIDRDASDASPPNRSVATRQRSNAA